jgi:mannobiose 2-epimerase
MGKSNHSLFNAKNQPKKGTQECWNKQDWRLRAGICVDKALPGGVSKRVMFTSDGSSRTHPVLQLRFGRICSAIVLLTSVAAMAGKAEAQPAAPPAGAARAPAPTPDSYRRLAGEVEANLQKEILDKWFPNAADEQGGGFFENYSQDWTRARQNNNRSLVYQSRLTWTSAQAARRYPARADLYLAMTRRGAAELMEKLWDKRHGGFYWTVDTSGQPVGQGASWKQVYGIAFGIYSLAASYEATKDRPALDFALKGFRWLDEHGHDDQNGGYFEVLNLDGSPARNGVSVVGARPGQKSMNTSIHILEAFTGLYKIWPDAALKARLQEMYDINLHKIYSEAGCLTMFFNPDWSRVAGRDSFGHDVETGFLLVEAAEALGQADPAAWSAARHLVDHALQYGWDNERGGLYDGGDMTAEGVVTGNLATDKIWWVEAEQLNVLLLLHSHYGKETRKYWDAFVQEWNYISRYQVDHQHGGWYPTVRADGSPVNGVKSDGWTECYHQGRSLLTVSGTLLRLADGK